MVRVNNLSRCRERHLEIISHLGGGCVINCMRREVLVKLIMKRKVNEGGAMKPWYAIILGFSIGLWSDFGHAICAINNMTGASGNLTINMGDVTDYNSASDVLTITADEIAAVTDFNSNIYLQCLENSSLTLDGGSEFQSSTNYLITNVDGVTISVELSQGIYPSNGGALSIPFGVGNYTVSDVYPSGIKIIRRYDRSTLIGGDTQTVSGGLLFTIKDDTGSFTILNIYINSFSVARAGCAVNSYDSTVSLGRVSASQLNVTGATANETDFNIAITCQSTSLAPAISFEGDTDPVYVNVFSNPTGATHASGVGIGLEYEGDAITPGTPVALNVLNTAMTNYTFSANYVRTGALISGNIEVPVTFTMTYE